MNEIILQSLPKSIDIFLGLIIYVAPISLIVVLAEKILYIFTNAVFGKVRL